MCLWILEDCRRKVEGAKRTIKDKEGLQYFAELERNPDPTRLRMVVKESEEACNPSGDAARGKPRLGSFDVLAYKERWESATVADKGEKLVDKNEFEFVKFWVNEKGKTPGDSQAMWQSALSNPKVEKGVDKDGNTTLPVCVETYTLVYNHKKKSNIAEGRVKEQKNPKAEDVDNVVACLDARQPDFDDGFFEGIRGENASHAVGSQSKSAFAGVQVTFVPMGAKRPCAASSSKSSKSSGGDGGDAPGALPDALEKKQKIDIDSKRNQLSAQWKDAVVTMGTKLHESLDHSEGIVSNFSEGELKSTDYAAFHETVLVRQCAAYVVLGDLESIKTTLGKVLGEDAGNIKDSDIDETTKDQMERGDVGPNTYLGILQACKKAAPCIGFAQCPTIATMTADADLAGAGCQTKA